MPNATGVFKYIEIAIVVGEIYFIAQFQIKNAKIEQANPRYNNHPQALKSRLEKEKFDSESITEMANRPTTPIAIE